MWPKTRTVNVTRQRKTLTIKGMRGLLYEDEQHGSKFDVHLHETVTLMNEWIRLMWYFHALFPHGSTAIEDLGLLTVEV